MKIAHANPLNPTSFIRVLPGTSKGGFHLPPLLESILQQSCHDIVLGNIRGPGRHGVLSEKALQSGIGSTATQGRSHQQETSPQEGTSLNPRAVKRFG